MPDGELTGEPVNQIQAHSQDNVYANQDQYLEKVGVHPGRKVIVYKEQETQNYDYGDDFFNLHI
jgi:hypothetical protein